MILNSWAGPLAIITTSCGSNISIVKDDLVSVTFHTTFLDSAPASAALSEIFNNNINPNMLWMLWNVKLIGMQSCRFTLLWIIYFPNAQVWWLFFSYCNINLKLYEGANIWISHWHISILTEEKREIASRNFKWHQLHKMIIFPGNSRSGLT